jgi:hypothetical protein
MEAYQSSQLQSLRAVEEFLTANADRLGTVVSSGARRQLTETLAALDAHAAEQAGSTFVSRGTTQRNRVLRRALVRDHMAPIVRMARTQLLPLPDGNIFQAPRPGWSVERLHAAAHGMATATAPHRAEFVRGGLDEDFVEALTSAADALVEAVNDRVQARGQVSGATRGLRTLLSSGRKLVDLLDALVVRALADDPALVANWRHVKRIRRRASTARDDAGAPAAAVRLVGAR